MEGLFRHNVSVCVWCVGIDISVCVALTVGVQSSASKARALSLGEGGGSRVEARGPVSRPALGSTSTPSSHLQAAFPPTGPSGHGRGHLSRGHGAPSHHPVCAWGPPATSGRHVGLPRHPQFTPLPGRGRGRRRRGDEGKGDEGKGR